MNEKLTDPMHKLLNLQSWLLAAAKAPTEGARIPLVLAGGPCHWISSPAGFSFLDGLGVRVKGIGGRICILLVAS